MRAEYKYCSMPAAVDGSGASSSSSWVSDNEGQGDRAPPLALHAHARAQATHSCPSRRGQATLQTDTAAQTIVATAQAIVFLTQWWKSEADVWTRVQPGLVLAALAAGLFFILRWPRYYWRNRWAACCWSRWGACKGAGQRLAGRLVAGPCLAVMHASSVVACWWAVLPLCSWNNRCVLVLS